VAKFTRRLSLLIVLGLFVVMAGAFLAVLYEKGFLSPSSSDSQSIIWQSGLAHLATDFTVADGKVFVTDGGDVFTYDAQSGESLWNASVGAYGPNTIKTYQGKVYVSGGESLVYKLDENKGTVELTFEAPAYSDLRAKATPFFFVADGRVFASYNGMAEYNATTGELFWCQPAEGSSRVGTASASAPESDFVFVLYNSRIDVNKGTRLWYVPAAYSSEPALVSQEQVILWNYALNRNYDYFNRDFGQIVVCVNASSGESLWSFDVGAPIFQPTASDGLVLFAAENGYFYALNQTDGTLEWKTYIDLLTLIVRYNQLSLLQKSGPYLSASPPLVDSQNQRIFWNIFVQNNEQNKYSGTVWSLDLSNGSRLWTTPVTGNPIYSTYEAVNMALLNTALYVSGQNNLFCLSASTGSIQWRITFDHNLLPPIAADNKVFVVGDGYVIAYK
jgi:outer membrane protein assembly factor BamB